MTSLSLRLARTMPALRTRTRPPLLLLLLLLLSATCLGEFLRAPPIPTPTRAVCHLHPRTTALAPCLVLRNHCQEDVVSVV